VALQSIDRSVTDRRRDVTAVRVNPAVQGGWDVIVTIDDRILASRHCDDWHRAERAVRAFEATFGTSAR
jgi:hypothetical protein